MERVKEKSFFGAFIQRIWEIQYGRYAHMLER